MNIDFENIDKKQLVIIGGGILAVVLIVILFVFNPLSTSEENIANVTPTPTQETVQLAQETPTPVIILTPTPTAAPALSQADIDKMISEAVTNALLAQKNMEAEKDTSILEDTITAIVESTPTPTLEPTPTPIPTVEPRPRGFPVDTRGSLRRKGNRNEASRISC